MTVIALFALTALSLSPGVRVQALLDPSAPNHLGHNPLVRNSLVDNPVVRSPMVDNPLTVASVAVEQAGVRPVPGAVVRPFHPPPHPYGPGHRGVDLAASGGAPVRSVRAGDVSWTGAVAGTSYVTIDHGGGLSTTYAEVVPAVANGDHVGPGQVIGHLAAGRDRLDWGARWDHEGQRTYVDPLLLLDALRPVLVPPHRGS